MPKSFDDDDDQRGAGDGGESGGGAGGGPDGGDPDGGARWARTGSLQATAPGRPAAPEDRGRNAAAAGSRPRARPRGIAWRYDQRTGRRRVPVLLSIGYSSCHWCHEVRQLAAVSRV
nr:DUF255 domain-containing protein [Tomitella gaofuii]